MNTNPSKPFFARESVWMALILILLGLRVAQAALPNAEEVYHYREVTGKSVKTAEWRLRKAEGFTLTYTSPTQRHVTTTGPDYATRRWTVTADSGQTDFTAERIGRTIHLHGRFKGQAVDKDLAIDDAPWYQATSLSLRGLSLQMTARGFSGPSATGPSAFTKSRPLNKEPNRWTRPTADMPGCTSG